MICRGAQRSENVRGFLSMRSCGVRSTPAGCRAFHENSNSRIYMVPEVSRSFVFTIVTTMCRESVFVLHDGGGTDRKFSEYVEYAETC